MDTLGFFDTICWNTWTARLFTITHIWTYLFYGITGSLVTTVLTCTMTNIALYLPMYITSYPCIRLIWVLYLISNIRVSIYDRRYHVQDCRTYYGWTPLVGVIHFMVILIYGWESSTGIQKVPIFIDTWFRLQPMNISKIHVLFHTLLHFVYDTHTYPFLRTLSHIHTYTFSVPKEYIYDDESNRIHRGWDVLRCMWYTPMSCLIPYLFTHLHISPTTIVPPTDVEFIRSLLSPASMTFIYATNETDMLARVGNFDISINHKENTLTYTKYKEGVTDPKFIPNRIPSTSRTIYHNFLLRHHSNIQSRKKFGCIVSTAVRRFLDPGHKVCMFLTLISPSSLCSVNHMIQGHLIESYVQQDGFFGYFSSLESVKYTPREIQSNRVPVIPDNWLYYHVLSMYIEHFTRVIDMENWYEHSLDTWDVMCKYICTHTMGIHVKTWTPKELILDVLMNGILYNCGRMYMINRSMVGNWVVPQFQSVNCYDAICYIRQILHTETIDTLLEGFHSIAKSLYTNRDKSCAIIGHPASISFVIDE